MELGAHCTPWHVGTSPFFLPMNGPIVSKGHPTTWSKEDVFKWVEWCIEEYSLGEIPAERFSMNGKALLLLSKEDFKERAPNSGDILYSTLKKILESLESPLTKSVLAQPYPSPFAFYPRPMTYGPPVRHHTDSGLSQVFLRTDNSPVLSPTALRFSPIRPRPSPVHSPGSDKHRMSASPPTEDTFPSPPQSASSESDASSADMPPTLNSPVAHKSEIAERLEKPIAMTDDHYDHQVSHMTENTEYPSENFASQKEKHESMHADVGHTKTLKMKNNKECRLLWEFIGRLLTDPKRSYESCIKWEDEGKLIFRITNPAFLAYLWGMQKNRSNMTYEKLSRALRYYYRMNIIEKVPGRRLTYRFMHPPDEIKVERAACRYRPERASYHSETATQQREPEMVSMESSAFLQSPSSPRMTGLEMAANSAATQSARVSPMEALYPPRTDSYREHSPLNVKMEIRTNGTIESSIKSTTGADNKNALNSSARDCDDELPQDLSMKPENRPVQIKQEVGCM